MAKKEILVAFGVDIDAVAGWLGSYGGEDSPDDISRGMFMTCRQHGLLPDILSRLFRSR